MKRILLYVNIYRSLVKNYKKFCSAINNSAASAQILKSSLVQMHTSLWILFWLEWLEIPKWDEMFSTVD